MALTSKQNNPVQEGVRHASGSRTGTRAAADFTVSLGFTPTRIKVTNLTDRVIADHTVDSALGTANAESKLTVAAGTVTYADCGISLTDDGKGFTVDVSVVNVETADDDVIWEAWG